MYEKIAVFLDGSENSEVVLPYVEDIAMRLNAELDIIGVSVGKEPSLSRPFKNYLEELVQVLTKKGIKAKEASLYGNSADEALKYSNQSDASIIAITTSGRPSERGWVLGSLAGKVLLKSVKPIIFISQKYAGEIQANKSLFQKILVPLDGSETGASALPWVKEIAQKTDATVCLLHVIVTPQKIIGPFKITADFRDHLINTLRQQSQEYLKKVIDNLEKENIKIQFNITIGTPSEIILDYARTQSIDLISISTHGHSGFGHFVLGSVANKVVHSTELPVMVVQAKSTILNGL